VVANLGNAVLGIVGKAIRFALRVRDSDQITVTIITENDRPSGPGASGHGAVVRDAIEPGARIGERHRTAVGIRDGSDSVSIVSDVQLLIPEVHDAREFSR